MLGCSYLQPYHTAVAATAYPRVVDKDVPGILGPGPMTVISASGLLRVKVPFYLESISIISMYLCRAMADQAWVQGTMYV